MWQNYSDQCIYEFPDLKNIDDRQEDLITIGADLEVPTLIYAYANGYFPMFINDNSMKYLGWYSPVERGIFEVNNIRVSRSLKQSIKKYECKIDIDFVRTMRSCMEVPRLGGWIDEDLIGAYSELHRLGFAHSVEVFNDQKYIGGLYGVSIGGLFAGESMVSIEKDASKVALVFLADHLKRQGITFIDTQWNTDHLSSLGAIAVNRDRYLEMLQETLKIPSISWV